MGTAVVHDTLKILRKIASMSLDESLAVTRNSTIGLKSAPRTALEECSRSDRLASRFALAQARRPSSRQMRTSFARLPCAIYLPCSTVPQVKPKIGEVAYILHELPIGDQRC
jgi:hypothetical protein